MRAFSQGQRVVVKQTEDGIPLHATGTVKRVRVRDSGAWVRLDERSKVSKAHPFPADDARGCDVVALPEDCELAKGNAAERRIAERDSKRPLVHFSTFGQDHWSTFAYVEDRCVDYKGEINRKHLRCDPKRHPLLAHEGSRGVQSPTRLLGGAPLANHDDWDCLDDLEEAGLLLRVGSGIQPQFQLSLEGCRISMLLRMHKMAGGSFGTFGDSDALKREIEEKKKAANE